MAWPFSAFGAPNVDSGFVALTTSYVDVPNIAAAAAWVVGLHVANGTGAQSVVSIKDAAGNVFVPLAVPDGFPIPIEWPFLPVVGKLQWKSVPAGVVAKIWGYQ